jgi:hypothetical protein
MNPINKPSDNFDPYEGRPLERDGDRIYSPPPPADSGIPGWMPVSALFAGLLVFGVIVYGATRSDTGAHEQQASPAQQTQPAQPSTTGSGSAQ